MSTSLAEQLQRLAVPQTSLLQRDKKRPSLLFDPQEAASLSRNTIYEIGIEGLEELISKNNVFMQFKNNLYHISSKEYDRSTKSEEANNQLDKTLKKFLLLLSPYFLLNASHKALEWLIHRYLIHEFNREELLMLILPYHESNIFVRVVQVLKFKDENDPFYFLKSLQKPGVHLPKQNLLNYATSNVGFLKFVTKFILQLIQYHDRPNLLTVAFNFYCTIFCGVIEFSPEIQDTHVSQMLQLLVQGLHSEIPDFCAASYVITARLVTKSSLTNKLLEKIVEKISEVKINGLKMEALLVLLVIYQSQKQYVGMSPAAVANLSEKEWLPEILNSLDKSGSYIYPFFEVLFKRCMEEGVNNDLKIPRDMIVSLLEAVTLDSAVVPTIIHSFLDVLRPKINYSEDVKKWLTEIIQLLEKQYPEDFDKAVHSILSVTDSKKNKRKLCLQKVLKNTMTYKGKFEVLEKLYHPQAHLRGEAVKYLTTYYDSLRDTDKDIIKNAFFDRLNDDKPLVVEETLKLIQKVQIMDSVKLRETLIAVASKIKENNQSGWSKVSAQILGMLCSDEKHDWNVFLTVLPYLLPNTEEELRTAQKLLELPFLSKNPLLKPNIKHLINLSSFEEFKNKLLQSIQDTSNIEDHSSFLQCLKNTDLNTSIQMSSAVIILTNTLPVNSMMENTIFVLEILQKFFEKDSDQPIYLQCLQSVIKKTIKANVNLSVIDFSNVQSKYNYFVIISSILLRESNSIYRKHLNAFLCYFCDDIETKLNFLLNIITSERDEISEKCKINAIKYISKAIKNADDALLKPLILNGHLITVYLLVLLNVPDQNTRIMSLNILELLLQAATRKTESYFYLIEGLLKHKEEILMDNEQMPIVVSNLLHPTNIKRKKNEKELTNICNNLLNACCNSTNPVYVKSGVLKLLSQINSFEMFDKTSKLVLDIIERNPTIINKFEAIIVLSNVNRVEPQILAHLNFDSNVWNLLEKGLKCDNIYVETEEKTKISISGLILSQFNREIFDILPESISKRILDLICEVATKTQNPEIPPSANRIFKHIDLDANYIVDQLIMMREVKSTKQTPNKIKSKRVSVIPTSDILNMIEWKKGVTMLEFIQDKKKIKNTHNLLPVLFDILKTCLDFDEQSAVEYTKQLILSLILLCCSRTESENLPANAFNMELVVQCIRASHNPQTHHHALLLLAHTAEIIPTQVLHHIMAIFTFMGSSLLRYDDAYSFQIITKIIDTVIPILVQDNHLKVIAKVLRVFVDALVDIPEHRRLPLYKQLLSKLDEKENLYIFLLLVFESHVFHNNQERQKKDSEPKRLKITTNLCYEFEPETVLIACVKLFKFLKHLPVEQEDLKIGDEEILNLKNYTPKQYRHLKFTLLTFVSNLLGSKEFVDKVAGLTQENVSHLESLYKEVIISILLYIQETSVVTEKAANTPQAQYWKRILHHSYEVLDCVNSLVTPQMFLLLTKGLIVHTLNPIKRKILELLNLKLEANLAYFENCNPKEVYLLVLSLLDLIEKSELGADQEKIVQTALISLKLLVKSQAPKDPQKFIQVLEYVTELLKSGRTQGDVLGSLILCLAELCVNLRAHAISCLADFMPAFLKVLKKQKQQETTSWLLFSILTTVLKLLDSLPMFLSPYLESLLAEISILTSKWGHTNDSKLQLFSNKLTLIKQKIGTVIPTRILIPAVDQTYDHHINKKYFTALNTLMDIFSENLSNLKGTDINANLPELTTFFLKALQFRSGGWASLEQANIVEEHIVKAFTVLILKLSESSFRPLYYKLFDWAVRSEESTERLITFYSFSSGIAYSLKGLFVLFAGHFVNNVAQMLDALNVVKTENLVFEDINKNILLLEYILKTLYAVFLYDNQKFTNKDRFDILMQPLVDQLENSLGSTEHLQTRNVNIITPCIVQLFLAASNDVLWKQMNYQILLKLRNASPEIRLFALHCLTEIVLKLGEDFLPMLPETIPFLAELLEDEEEKVEKACQKAVQEMEKVLGEPLQKYF